MLHPPTDNGLEQLLCGAATQFERAMREQLRDEEVNFRQFQVLCHLAVARRLTQVELAQRMNLTPSSLVAIVDRLEEQRLVARRDCPGDRRSKWIEALPGAREVWQRVMALAGEVDRRAMAHLTSEQVEQLQESLGVVLASLGMQPPSRRKVAT